MRIDSFARSAAFGAVAALGWATWLAVTAPFIGAPAPRAVYLVVASALYAGGLAGSTARRVRTAFLVLVTGAVLAVVARGIPELAIALAVVLGVTRSGCLHRAAPARTLAVEGVLIFGGLLFARFLAGDAGRGAALALWGFALVQSCFFLMGGIESRPRDGRHPDPFEDACARASEVLERPVG